MAKDPNDSTDYELKNELFQVFINIITVYSFHQSLSDTEESIKNQVKNNILSGWRDKCKEKLQDVLASYTKSLNELKVTNKELLIQPEEYQEIFNKQMIICEKIVKNCLWLDEKK